MNVALTVIFVLEIAATFTQIGAYPNWSWGAKDKHKWWSRHHSETYQSCATGHCVKEWKCSKPAVVTYSEKDSCTYRENGPWVCCLVNDDSPYYWDYTDIESPDNFKRTTIKPQKVSTSSSTDKHWHNKNDGTFKPILKESRNRNEGEEFSNVKPLRDMKNDRENHTFYRPRDKTIEPKIPNTIVTNSAAESYHKSSANTNYKQTTNAWDKSHASTSSPQYYKRTTNKPRTSSTNYTQRTTNSWDRPHVPESRIIFPIEKDMKHVTASPPTKRSWSQSTSTKAGSEYTTAHTRRILSTTTKNPSIMKSTVSTKASSQKRNQDWGRSTTSHPARSPTINPKATRPSSTQFTRKSTRRYRVTTPLPNVNMHSCGFREERRNIRRQTRDNNNYGRNPDVDVVYSDNSRSRGRLPYQRIVGGKEAEPFSWPWVAALYKVTSSGGNRFLSAGSLINENFILTAAHVFTPDDLKTASYVAMLGTHDAQDAVAQYIVSSVLLHPKYEHRYYYNDIALLKLERKVLFNDYIMPVCLPSPTAPLHSEKDLLGKNVTVMGWGDDSFGGKSSQVLKEASFPILSRVSCNASYVRVASNRFPKGITAEMLCAGDPKGGKDACQGDSGGPLTVIENGRYTQVGIVSFGYKCGDKEFPGVYTKVAPYLSWIAENTRYVDGSTDYDYYQ